MKTLPAGYIPFSPTEPSASTSHEVERLIRTVPITLRSNERAPLPRSSLTATSCQALDHVTRMSNIVYWQFGSLQTGYVQQFVQSEYEFHFVHGKVNGRQLEMSCKTTLIIKYLLFTPIKWLSSFVLRNNHAEYHRNVERQMQNESNVQQVKQTHPLCISFSNQAPLSVHSMFARPTGHCLSIPQQSIPSNRSILLKKKQEFVESSIQAVRICICILMTFFLDCFDCTLSASDGIGERKQIV